MKQGSFLVTEKASVFVAKLKRYRGILSTQQIRTLKGQALSGQLGSAERGLEKLLKGQ